MKLALVLLSLSLCWLLAPFAQADSQQVLVQVRYAVDTPYGQYQDALYYTEAEYPSVDQKAIDTEKQARVDAWVQAILNPVPPAPETVDSLTKQIAEIDQLLVIDLPIQKQLLQGKLDALQGQ